MLPGTAYRTRFGVLKSPVGDGTQVATLFCITTDERIVRDERLIRAIVDSCLAPALRDEEKATLSTWLTEQDYSRDAYADRELPRFHAELVSAGTVFQVLLVSKDRTVGPGPIRQLVQGLLDSLPHLVGEVEDHQRVVGRVGRSGVRWGSAYGSFSSRATGLMSASIG